MQETVRSALDGWQRGDGPLYRRLADALRAAVADGSLPAGDRLPTERALAASLAVSRSTVVAAYDVLRDEGWIERRQGSGTTVRRRGPAAIYGEERAHAGRASTSFRALIEGPSDAIEFTVAATPAPALFEGPALEAAIAALVEASRDAGYQTLGHPPLRRALADHLSSWGLPTTEREVMVTTGAQQAIDLAIELYTRPGDAVVVEDPTYLAVLDRFAAAGVRLATTRIGPRGVRAADLRVAAEDAGARLAYLIPTFHNPTGALVPEEERREIARVAEGLQLPIVEDLTLADVSLMGPPPPPIGAFARDVPVVTVGSLSKLFWGGLRVGFVRAPEPVIQRLARIKLVADHGSSVVSQVFAASLLVGADAQRTIRERLARERLDVLTALLRVHLPEWRWTEPAGGLCLWVRVPDTDTAAFAETAARHGVAVVPGAMTSPTGAFRDHLRMPFVLEPDLLEEGVRRLAAAWRDHRAGAPAPERRLRVVV
jgi:DNA-binding transcriptional MocR family regulator